MRQEDWFNLARDYEVKQEIDKAVDTYEYTIAHSSEVPEECFINLSMLYWHCTDYGFIWHHTINDRIKAIADDRMLEVLTLSETMLGHVTPEIRFWQKYIHCINLGADSFVDVALDIVEKSDILVPYFYIFAHTGDVKYKPYVIKLQEAVLKDYKTLKNQYILSIINNLL